MSVRPVGLSCSNGISLASTWCAEEAMTVVVHGQPASLRKPRLCLESLRRPAPRPAQVFVSVSEVCCSQVGTVT